ncbi:hypothetical protein EDB81DRAFT_17896 [Dactylonectria macrodidyma]|uniref:Uncharacterized protein n=1 Tax=Dactylonectria macrodidyma TaxID=307937 RepID=A0A9P9JMI8_9HYPO|nr:hypothetical protein EDB81DRAFT_17896 [Dactylonectria macrodidyma]
MSTVVKINDAFRMLDAPPFLANPGRYADSNSSPTEMFCQFQPCGPCTTSDESATFHNDCVNLFRMESPNKPKILQNLWFIARSRTPFHHFPLPPPRFDNISTAFRTIASKGYALSAFTHLPVELCRMIWSYSPSAHLWQYSSVMGLAHELETTADVSSCYSLSTIKSWSREEQEASLTSDLGFMRLTFDQDGLSKIERLREVPKEHDSRDTLKMYVIEPSAALSCVTIEFKFNRARLSIPSATTIRIWDTPAPPDLKRCLFLSYSGPTCSRFVTIPTRNCTGLTFFYWHQFTKAIHAHTERSPFAQETFNKLPFEFRENLVWIYVPLTSNNPIVGFGVRLIRGRFNLLLHLPCFLLRMKLSGDLTIGPYHGTNTEDITRKQQIGQRLCITGPNVEVRLRTSACTPP